MGMDGPFIIAEASLSRNAITSTMSMVWAKQPGGLAAYTFAGSGNQYGLALETHHRSPHAFGICELPEPCPALLRFLQRLQIAPK